LGGWAKNPILDARGRRLGFELVKQGLRGFRLHYQEMGMLCEDFLGKLSGDPRIELLKKAVESGPDQTLEFAFGRQFNAELPATGIRAFAQIVLGRGRGCSMPAQPGLEGLLVLPSGEAEARVLSNEQQMAVVCRTLPRIIWRVVPQQLELMRDEGPDGRRHLGEGAGEIAQILDRFEQDRHPMAIHRPITGVNQGAFGWR
jgi:hypothetical protein